MSKMTTCEEGHLFDQLRNASCPFCDFKPVKLRVGEGQNPKQLVASPQQQAAVGWLVGLNGALQGRDFRLCAGLNRLGAHAECHVQFNRPSIASPQDWAHLIFDAAKSSFSLLVPHGGIDVRVNQKKVMLLSSCVLHTYDVIDIGGDRLVFMALCGDRFSWLLDESSA